MQPQSQVFLQDKIMQLANALPDIPRFVETRGMLRSHACEIFGLSEGKILSFVVRSLQTGLIAVIGTPSVQAIKRAVQQNTQQNAVLAFDDNIRVVAESLSGWKVERAILHQRINSIRLADVPKNTVRYLNAEEIRDNAEIPAGLKNELIIAAKATSVAATIIDDKPVSFCYAGWETETLWDVSIDTLKAYRGHGHALACVTFLINEMNARNKQPVWGAVESNAASLKLAKKLFFEPVDALFVFEH
ncbi:MAG: GNAT family N-acetyltransferase [Acidobacteriota bacterium]